MRVDTVGPDDVLDRLLDRVDGDDHPPLAVLDPTWPQALRDDAVRALADAEDRGSVRRGDLVLFTSGSSGRAKGVVRDLASWRASREPLTVITGITATDEVWLPLPLSSGLSLYGAFHAAGLGARILRTSSTASPPPTATAAHLVPGLLEQACAAVEAGAPSRLRTVVVAGAALPSSVRARAARLGWDVVEYYGAAELSFVGWRRGGGPMATFPGAQVRVTDDVLWVRSPYLCRGYLTEQPGAPLRRDGAWATVGDLARIVGDGWEVLGRGDAAVQVGGHTVVVEEVEDALGRVDGVLDVAVLGLDDERQGRLLAAVVVVAQGVRRVDLTQAARALPSPARPRRWLQANRLPRTATGKVARAAVADLADQLPPLP